MESKATPRVKINVYKILPTCSETFNSRIEEEQCGAVWGCVELCGAVRDYVELSGAVWSCVGLCGAV